MKLVFKVDSIKRFIIGCILFFVVILFYEVYPILFSDNHSVLLKSSIMMYGYALGFLLYSYLWFHLSCKSNKLAKKLKNNTFYTLVVSGLLIGIVFGASIAGLTQYSLKSKGYQSTKLDIIYSIGDWNYYHKTFTLE